jgi:chitosanase
MGDMDIDCDGPDFRCPYNSMMYGTNHSNNHDGHPRTSYGNLSAYAVPYIVVPQSYVEQAHTPDNAISVVICGGKMYYAIMGDTNGNTPEVIGEASWLLGQTCFPTEGLNGGKGHAPLDVICICHHCKANGDIVFNKEFTGLNRNIITDYPGLRALGDAKMATLINALNKTNWNVTSTAMPTASSSSGTMFFILATTLLLTFLSL